MSSAITAEIGKLSDRDLRSYILSRAQRIVRETLGEDWDDPDLDEFIVIAAELAHAIVELNRRGPRLSEALS